MGVAGAGAIHESPLQINSPSGKKPTGGAIHAALLTKWSPVGSPTLDRETTMLLKFGLLGDRRQCLPLSAPGDEATYIADFEKALGLWGYGWQRCGDKEHGKHTCGTCETSPRARDIDMPCRF